MLSRKVILLSVTLLLSGLGMASAQNLFSEGRSFEREEDLAGAERRYRQVMRLNPNHKKAAHRLVEVLLDRGKWEEAYRTASGRSDQSSRLLRIAGELKEIESHHDKVLSAVKLLYPTEHGVQQKPQPAKVARRFDKLSGVRMSDRLTARIRYWRAQALLAKRTVAEKEYATVHKDLSKGMKHLGDRPLWKDAHRDYLDIDEVGSYYRRKYGFIWPFTQWEISALSSSGAINATPMLGNVERRSGTSLAKSPISRSLEIQAAVIGKNANGWRLSAYGRWGSSRFYDCSSDRPEGYECRYSDIFAEHGIYTTDYISTDPSESDYNAYGSMSMQEYGVRLTLWLFQFGYGSVSYDIDGEETQDFRARGQTVGVLFKGWAPLVGTWEVPRVAAYLTIGIRRVFDMDVTNYAEIESLSSGSPMPINTFYSLDSATTWPLGVGISVWL